MRHRRASTGSRFAASTAVSFSVLIRASVSSRAIASPSYFVGDEGLVTATSAVIVAGLTGRSAPIGFSPLPVQSGGAECLQ